MKKDEMHHAPSSVERRVREADVISRAKAATPLAGAGRDRLDDHFIGGHLVGKVV